MLIAGIDIGGTFIKGGLVNEQGEILYHTSVKTECTKEGLADGVTRLIGKLLQEKGIAREELGGIGMGIPGMIDSVNGCVRYSNNLRIRDFAIVEAVRRKFDLPIRITNDANAAALGEAKFGVGAGKKDFLLITLGTGVGGGVILDGKIFEGTAGAGAELGHAVLIAGGELCTCGRRGCIEAYASATALIRDTRRAMEQDPSSAMWSAAGDLEHVDGKTAFSCAGSDQTAKEVVDRYIWYLGEALTDFANIFRPQMIALGGGVSNAGEELRKPLQEHVDANLFGGSVGPRVEIVLASLGNRAGLLGAAAMLLP